MVSLLSLTQSDHRGTRGSVDFLVTSWTMPDLPSSLVRLGRLMELQGIASAFRAGTAEENGTKRKSKAVNDATVDYARFPRLFHFAGEAICFDFIFF